MHFGSGLIAELAPQGALEEILAEKVVANAWRLRRVPPLEAALYWREERQKGNSRPHARRYHLFTKQALCGRWRNRRIRAPINPKYAQIDAKPIKAAVAELQELYAEPIPPLVSLLSDWKGCSRYCRTSNGTKPRSSDLNEALHELQRFQAIRAGERVPAPAAVDVDVNINGNGAINRSNFRKQTQLAISQSGVSFHFDALAQCHERAASREARPFPERQSTSIWLRQTSMTDERAPRGAPSRCALPLQASGVPIEQFVGKEDDISLKRRKPDAAQASAAKNAARCAESQGQSSPL